MILTSTLGMATFSASQYLSFFFSVVPTAGS